MKRTPTSIRVANVTADELLRMRLIAGLSQGRVAALSGIKRPIVSRIERAVHATSLDVCARYVAACGGDLLDVTRAIDSALGLPREAGVR